METSRWNCGIICGVFGVFMRDNARTFALCVVAESLNLISSYVFYEMLHIPLFMDTIFTVAITFYCGLLPALGVAVFYNVISCMTSVARGYAFDPYIALFGLCGAVIVLVTWFFARRKQEFRISLPVTMAYLFLIAVISSFCSIFTSGIIDYIRFSLSDIPDRIAPVKNFTDSFQKQHFSLLASCILGQIPVALTDRIVTTFAGFGVYRLMVSCFGEERW